MTRQKEEFTGRGREFDRHVSGTGRGKELKKEGGGAHNWGQPGTELLESPCDESDEIGSPLHVREREEEGSTDGEGLAGKVRVAPHSESLPTPTLSDEEEFPSLKN